jgi:hypothetical protein
MDHVADRELPEIAAVALAVGMALGDFGEGVAPLQFGQRGLDARAGLLRALVFGDVFHDVGGVK